MPTGGTPATFMKLNAENSFRFKHEKYGKLVYDGCCIYCILFEKQNHP